jgi:hypothetical protein
LDAEVLRQRYDDADGCVDAFTKDLDETITAGFLLQLDRQAIIDAQHGRAAEAFDTT